MDKGDFVSFIIVTAIIFMGVFFLFQGRTQEATPPARSVLSVNDPQIKTSQDSDSDNSNQEENQTQTHNI